MLDIRTMYFLLMLSSVVAGICMLGLKVPPGDRRRSAILWGFGSFSVASGLLFIGLRHSIPLWPSAVLGNTLLFWGFLLFYLGFSLLMGRPQQNRTALLIALAYGVIYHFLVTLEVPVRYRISIVSLMLMGISAGMIIMARQAHPANPHTRSARLLVQFFYGTVFVMALARGAHSTFFDEGASQIFEATPVQIISFLSYYFALIGAGIAYLLMQNGLTYHELAIIANRDMLTGVRNRRNFLEMAERDLALAQRMWRPLTVLMLDLDHFKRINDEFGHLAGDEVLRRFGSILRGAVREVDLVGRYGGEEFCIVLADTAPESAQHTAERIRQEFAATEISSQGKRIPVSVSIGIAGMLAGDARTIQELLSAADAALYAAKNGGRNRISFGRAA